MLVESVAEKMSVPKKAWSICDSRFGCWIYCIGFTAIRVSDLGFIALALVIAIRASDVGFIVLG